MALFGGLFRTPRAEDPRVTARRARTTAGEFDPYAYLTPEQRGYYESFRAPALEAAGLTAERQRTLGQLDPRAFERLYAPMREELERGYTRELGTLESNLAARGILPEGSFAATGGRRVGESSPYGRLYSDVTREMSLGRERAMREAGTQAIEEQGRAFERGLRGLAAFQRPYESLTVSPESALGIQEDIYGGARGEELAKAERKRKRRGALFGLGGRLLGGGLGFLAGGPQGAAVGQQLGGELGGTLGS